MYILIDGEGKWCKNKRCSEFFYEARKINDNRTIDSDQVIYVQIVLSSMNNSPSYS